MRVWSEVGAGRGTRATTIPPVPEVNRSLQLLASKSALFRAPFSSELAARKGARVSDSHYTYCNYMRHTFILLV